jgi:hypothetical protein
MTEQAKHMAAPRYTAVELPDQDDAYSWAISESGVGLVPGLNPGRPQRFDSKRAAEARISQIIGDRLRDAAPDLLSAAREYHSATQARLNLSSPAAPPHAGLRSIDRIRALDDAIDTYRRAERDLLAAIAKAEGRE